MILLQAITPTGSISADWVLISLVGFIAVLFTVIASLCLAYIKSMRDDLKAGVSSLTSAVKEHDDHLGAHDMKLIELRTSLEHQKENFTQHVATYHKS